MSKKSLCLTLAVALLSGIFGAAANADDGQASSANAQASSSGSKSSSTAAAKAKPKSKLETLTDGMTKVDGLFTLYHNDQKLLAVIKSSDINKDFIVLTSIARGISSGYVLGGMSWGFDDDIVWTFKKVGDDKIHLLRRNVRFKAKSGSPEANAVKLAYSDSVLYALPVLTKAGGGSLVDLTRIFMSDDQQIGRAIGPGFRFVSDRSTWAKVKAFPENVELQVAAVYAGSHGPETVSDPRGVQVNVHYSISKLPTGGYTPRKADDRVGYFLTVVKDFSDDEDDQHFVRYINRWNLKKKAPKASLSPPEEPIIFYMEKTVPVHLRPYVQSGIEEWNKAFEKLGFANAIQVRQQDDGDDRDPEDVRYNFFRWITAEAGFAMGPSRVNPKTGQILDADIIFDASFLRYWTTDYETFTPEDAQTLLSGGRAGVKLPEPFVHLSAGNRLSDGCTYNHGMQHQMGFAAAAMLASGMTDDKGKLPDEFIHQALKEVVMHEVGHTLGLRHNFKASTWKNLKQIEETAKGSDEATAASVMDYLPANIAPSGAKQGPYYTATIGPYDYWAIEYGYTSAKDDELKKIAARGAESGHDYATDEDTRSSSSDPLTNRYDLGTDPVKFAERQMKLSTDLLPKVVDRSVKEGEGYQRARQAFGLLFSEFWRSAIYAARFPGGVLVHRDHKGDENARAPFKIVEAEKQRDAMKIVAEYAFASPTYSPEVLNHLAATRWRHWGIDQYSRLDYPIHDYVEMMQSIILYELINSTTLTRIHDSEVKVADDQDAYTLAEHVNLLVDSIFSEWKVPDQPGEFTNRKPYISSFRRNLQRTAVKRLASLVTSSYTGPEDARTLARMHLSNLDGQITAILAKEDLKLDDYSRAHLLDSQKRIQQILNANLELRTVN